MVSLKNWGWKMIKILITLGILFIIPFIAGIIQAMSREIRGLGSCNSIMDDYFLCTMISTFIGIVLFVLGVYL